MQTTARTPSIGAGYTSHAVAPTHGSDLDRIFAQYLDPIYHFLYRRIGNREDAEDLTSHVFLKASQQLDSARPEASVASWLFTVARSVLADHWRRYYRVPPPVALNEEVAAEQPHGTSANVPSQSTVELLEVVLQSLPSRYRRVLELRFLDGLSVDEAAREMDVTTGNLKVLQHRALARAAIGFPDGEAKRAREMVPVGMGCTVTASD